MSKIYLRPKDLCDRWAGTVKPNTLTNWRIMGTGPRYSKLGRNVLYHIEDVKEYEAQKSFASRAEEIEFQNNRDQTATTNLKVID